MRVVTWNLLWRFGNWRERQPAIAATLDHPDGAPHVVVSCVEWEPDLAEDHLAQTRALATLLHDPALDGPLPVLLTADLSAGPDGPEVRALTDVLVDTWAAGGGAPDAVTLSSKNPLAPLAAVKQIDRRVDYILARPGTAGRPVAVHRAFFADTPVAGVYPSDRTTTRSWPTWRTMTDRAPRAPTRSSDAAGIAARLVAGGMRARSADGSGGHG